MESVPSCFGVMPCYMSIAVLDNSVVLSERALPRTCSRCGTVGTACAVLCRRWLPAHSAYYMYSPSEGMSEGMSYNLTLTSVLARQQTQQYIRASARSSLGFTSTPCSTWHHCAERIGQLVQQTLPSNLQSLCIVTLLLAVYCPARNHSVGGDADSWLCFFITSWVQHSRPSWTYR